MLYNRAVVCAILSL